MMVYGSKCFEASAFKECFTAFFNILKPKTIDHVDTEIAESVSGIATFEPKPMVQCITHTATKACHQEAEEALHKCRISGFQRLMVSATSRFNHSKPPNSSLKIKSQRGINFIMPLWPFF